MIVFPILNFVLSLMYTSFVLAGDPQTSCTECGKKPDLRVSENKKHEEVEQKNQDIIKADLIEERHTGGFKFKIPARKDE